jgi:hypothetical protein
MMGRQKHDQGQLFYSFCLEEVVPDDHLVREIAAVLDLSWVHAELAPYYPKIGRPSIDPVLMIRNCRLRLRHPLGAAAVPGGEGQPGVPLVLRLEHRGHDPAPLGVLACEERALP